MTAETDMTPLIEQIARAIYEADDPWHEAFPWPNPDGLGAAANYRRIATAILPIIQAAIAAETERCARVAEDHCYSIDIGTWAAMTKKEHSAYACDSIAAAIRSQP